MDIWAQAVLPMMDEFQDSNPTKRAAQVGHKAVALSASHIAHLEVQSPVLAAVLLLPA
jgi:hypothetical protein